MEIVYVLGEYPDTPEGNFMKHVRASVAEFEREKIKERSARGRVLKAKSGSVMSHGKVVYGYRLADNNGKVALVVHEPEARIVRLIFDWYNEGDGDGGRLGTLEIMRRLTATGVPRPSDGQGAARPNICGKRKPGEWLLSTIYGILKNEVYAGCWRYGKRRAKDNPDGLVVVTVPAIVPRDYWEATQARLKANRKNAGRAPKHNYLLSRRVRCAACDSSVTARSVHNERQTPHLYYACRSNSTEALRRCTAKVWRAPFIDGRVWAWVKEIMQDPATVLERMRDRQAEQDEANARTLDRLKVTDELIAERRSELERAADMYQSKVITKKSLIERKARLDEAIAGLEKERAKIAARMVLTVTPEQIETVEQFAANVRKRLPYADKHFAARRELIEALDMTASLAWEDGEWAVYARCVVGEQVLYNDSKSFGHTVE